MGTPLPHPTKAEGSTVVVEVPEVFASLANDLSCFVPKPDVPAGCQAPLVPSGQDQPVETYVGRYPPLYYALVGWPTLILVTVKGIYAARLVSGALSAAMLALAVVSVRRCRGTALMGAAVSLAVTPLALYLAGVINPSGLEISSAIAAWSAAMALASQSAQRVSTASVTALGLPVVVLMLVRPLSPLWVVAIVGAFLVVRPAAPLLVLVKKRSAQAWTGAAVLAGAASALWDTLEGALRSTPGTALPHHATENQIIIMALDRVHSLVSWTIGQFGWLDTPSPFGVTVAWTGALGCVVLISVCVARRREVLAVAGTLVVWLLFTFIFIVAMAPHHGILGQGRDFMGLIVGLPIVAGAVTRDSLLGRRLVLRLSGLLLAILSLCQVTDFYGVLRRYTVGLGGPTNAFASVAGGWRPPLPGPLLVGVFALAIGGFALIVQRAARAQESYEGAVPLLTNRRNGASSSEGRDDLSRGVLPPGGGEEPSPD